MEINLVGLSGSLRSHSYNTALLHALGVVLPVDVGFEIHDFSAVPLYNADLEGEYRPPAVCELREAIAAADGIVIATPEYNHGIPGVLQNALDWASRPAFESPLAGKPAGVLSASRGPVGGARAQSVLRQVLGATLTPIFPHVEMLVPAAHRKFDEDGRLIDPDTEERLRRYAGSFVEWVREQKN